MAETEEALDYDESLDEISANIAQCLEQRTNYLNNSNNLSYITSRFNFYKEAIKTAEFIYKKLRKYRGLD